MSLSNHDNTTAAESSTVHEESDDSSFSDRENSERNLEEVEEQEEMVEAHTYAVRCPDCGSRQAISHVEKLQARSHAHNVSRCPDASCDRLRGTRYVGQHEIHKEDLSNTDVDDNDSRMNLIISNWGQGADE